LDQLFGDSRIDDRQRRRASVRRSRGAEFEPVAGKGERRGAVAVGVVEQDVGNFTDVELDVGLFIGRHLLVADPLFDRVEHVRQGRTGENRHHGRWCFVCAEAVRIGLGGDRGHKQRAVVVCGLDRVDEEGKELDVVLRGFARGQ